MCNCFDHYLCCRLVREKQRQIHDKLAVGKSIPLSLHCKYYLIPHSWLSKWRTYINATGRNVSSVEKPETLDGIMDLIKCEKVTCNFTQ